MERDVMRVLNAERMNMRGARGDAHAAGKVDAGRTI